MATLMQVKDRLTGPRVVTTWVDVLDRDDNQVARLTGSLGWRVEANLHADVRAQMTLTLTGGIGQDIDWLTCRLQPWKAVNDIAWPRGVYVPTSPEDAYASTGLRSTIRLLDKTSLLRDVLPGSFAVHPGQVVTDVITALIQGAGITKIAITPSTATQRALSVWGPAERRSKIIAVLLDSIGYTALHADDFGWLRAGPARRPQDRPIAYDFESGPDALHSPSWTRTQNLTGIPNQRVLISPGDADMPPLIGIAQNTDPDSPYGIPRRGIVPHEADPEQVEATSQAEINALTQRRLQDGQNPVATLEVEHAPLPLALGDVVRFAPSASHERLAVIQAWSDSSATATDARMRATWREVADDG